MSKIGGNLEAVVQICDLETDEYGVEKRVWKNAFEKPIMGFLDVVNEGTNTKSLMKRVEESDYIFLCDYFRPVADRQKLSAENSRLIINGEIYEVKLYDDPMILNRHMEIHLKYLGGQV